MDAAVQHPFDDRDDAAPGEPPARTFTVPVLAAPSEGPPFPLIAAIAPVIGAVAIWLVTGSPYVLLFAGLGPVVAVAGVIDRRRGVRKQRSRDRIEYEESLVELGRAVTEEIQRRRFLLEADTPGARELLADSRNGDNRWRADDARLRVALGFGPVPSGLRLADGGGRLDQQAARLRQAAATIQDAPVVADCAAGIAICGPGPIVRAIARGYLVQLVSAHSPERLRLVLPDTDQWLWGSALPHTAAHLSAPFGRTLSRAVLDLVDLSEASDGAPWRGSEVHPVPQASPDAPAAPGLIVLAPGLRQLPPGCSTVVLVAGLESARIIVGTRLQAQVRIEPVTSAEAARFAAVLHEHARERGVAAPVLDQWRPVRLTELWSAEPPAPRGVRVPIPVQPTLIAPVGRSGTETITLDLIADGPHALIGGTTGSGKSELLVTWVAAMAAAYSPSAVTFLLVDFKGGAAFAPLAALAHCVGVITDLGRTEATRALESLGAEIRYREEILRGFSARDITDLPAHTLPRLVVVVDEFAAMLVDFPDLYALFVDIAARGRSLGMHVILCTQRPAGVVRDALLANCNLRLSLRVNNDSDSEAVIGTAAAATLPASSPGACLVSASGRVIGFMVATTCAQAIAQIDSGSMTPAQPPRRPWLDPLPSVINPAALQAVVDAEESEGDRRREVGAFLLGMTDLPERQRQDVLRYCPAIDGNLLLLGAARTGKSNGLRLLAQSQSACRVLLVPRGIEGAWDTLTEMANRARSGGAAVATLLLIDDLDSLLARIPTEYTSEFLAAVQLLARDGGRVGIQLAAAIRRTTGLAGILPLFEQTIMLRMASREEHVLAGGEAARWDAALPPGGGIHRGHRVHLALADDPGAAPEPEPAAVRFLPGRTYVLVSAWPGRRVRQLRVHADSVCVIDIGEELDRAREHTDRETPGGPIAERAPGSGALRLGEARATVLVGDVEQWQTHSVMLGRLRRENTLVFDGSSLAEFRMITRSRQLPPPLEPNASRVWWLARDAEVVRALWPPG